MLVLPTLVIHQTKKGGGLERKHTLPVPDHTAGNLHCRMAVLLALITASILKAGRRWLIELIQK